MVAIAPFRAVRYDPARVPLAQATSPPHDCIPAALRDRLLRQRDGIVHVTLGADRPHRARNGAAADRFTRARDTLARWLADGTMVQDATPALYRYTVRHGPPGGRRTLSGLLAMVEVDPAGAQVFPHERTLASKRRDGRRLREATGFDCEPIWLLYEDPQRRVERSLAEGPARELLRFTDAEGSEHALGRVDDPAAVAAATLHLRGRPAVIADGHHRYRTAVEHAAATGDPRHAAILAFLVRSDDPGVAVEPTHRVVDAPGFPLAEALRRAAGEWAIEPLAWDGRDPAPLLARLPPGADRLVLAGHRPDGPAAFLLAPREAPARGTPAARLAALPVARLHRRLLPRSWGGERGRDPRLRFTRSAAEAVQAVHGSPHAFAALLPAVPVATVLEVAAHGLLMPRKSTHFSPKPRSGVVLAALEGIPASGPWLAAAAAPGLLGEALAAPRALDA